MVVLKYTIMKKLFLALIAAMLPTMISAQELTVTYQVVYNTSSPYLFAEAGLSEEMRSNLAAAYKDVVMTYRLKLKGNESEFRIVPGEGKQEITFMGQKIDVNAASLAQAQNYTYKNHADGIVLEKTQLFGKSFIVSDSIKSEAYSKIENEKKNILGFECTKAISADGKTTVWYTSGIPVKDEPIACGLDGLVLQFDNGQQIFTATEILDTVDTEIIRPSGEKPITREEFTNFVNKRVEMMKRN